MVVEWLERNAQDDNEEKITQQMEWFTDATVSSPVFTLFTFNPDQDNKRPFDIDLHSEIGSKSRSVQLTIHSTRNIGTLFTKLIAKKIRYKILVYESAKTLN